MKHWNKNLEIAKSANWFLAEKYNFTQRSCSLCVEYTCEVNCPLTLAGYNCIKKESPYKKVVNLFTPNVEQVKELTTQKDLIGAIEYMITCLEEVTK